jgi:hypothetical protein
LRALEGLLFPRQAMAAGEIIKAITPELGQRECQFDEC